MLNATSHRGPDGCGFLVGHVLKLSDSLPELGAEDVDGSIGIANARLAIVGGGQGAQPIRGCDGWSIVFNGEIYNHDSLRMSLKSHNFKTETDTEVIVHLFEENLKRWPLINAVEKTVSMLDGMFAFALLRDNTVVICRDQFGVKPLYYFSGKEGFAFSSERKGLWRIGIRENVRSLPPGMILTATHGRIDTMQTVRLALKQPLSIDMEGAAERLTQLLKESVSKMLGKGVLGVLFSGGLDSSIIAKIASEISGSIVLYSASFPASRDCNNALEAAKLLKLPMKIEALSLDKISEEVSKLQYAIEDSSPMQLAIAIPIYFACKLASMDRVKILLSAQGADELFGGYMKHEKILRAGGELALQKELLREIQDLHEVNLARDDRASMASGIELRLPFLSREIVEYALALPAKYKVAPVGGLSYSRKHILRLVGRKLGLPPQICNRPKIAAQYGSNAMRAVRRLVRSGSLSTVSSRP